jgi:hypothetical protein
MFGDITDEKTKRLGQRESGNASLARAAARRRRRRHQGREE